MSNVIVVLVAAAALGALGVYFELRWHTLQRLQPPERPASHPPHTSAANAPAGHRTSRRHGPTLPGSWPPAGASADRQRSRPSERLSGLHVETVQPGAPVGAGSAWFSDREPSEAGFAGWFVEREPAETVFDGWFLARVPDDTASDAGIDGAAGRAPEHLPTTLDDPADVDGHVDEQSEDERDQDERDQDERDQDERDQDERDERRPETPSGLAPDGVNPRVAGESLDLGLGGEHDEPTELRDPVPVAPGATVD